jgi:hypothetical protein
MTPQTSPQGATCLAVPKSDLRVTIRRRAQGVNHLSETGGASVRAGTTQEMSAGLVRF